MYKVDYENKYLLSSNISLINCNIEQKLKYKIDN